MLSRRHALDGWTPKHTHTHTCTYTCLHLPRAIHTHTHTMTLAQAPISISMYAHSYTQTHSCCFKHPGQSFQPVEDYKSASGLPRLDSHAVLLWSGGSAWESIKYITHMQIFTDGMTGGPSQSFRYVYRSLVRRLCDYSGLCATEGQRDNSFDMRYVLMWRQWVLTVCAIISI